MKVLVNARAHAYACEMDKKFLDMESLEVKPLSPTAPAEWWRWVDVEQMNWVKFHTQFMAGMDVKDFVAFAPDAGSAKRQVYNRIIAQVGKQPALWSNYKLTAKGVLFASLGDYGAADFQLPVVRVIRTS